MKINNGLFFFKTDSLGPHVCSNELCMLKDIPANVFLMYLGSRLVLQVAA